MFKRLLAILISILAIALLVYYLTNLVNTIMYQPTEPVVVDNNSDDSTVNDCDSDSLVKKGSDVSGSNQESQNSCEPTEAIGAIQYQTSDFIPEGYYDSIEGLTGDELKSALNDVITGHIEYPYTSTKTDVWDILRAADEDPENTDNVIVFYSGFSHPKDCQDTTKPPLMCEGVEWNREHIWSKSRGDFAHENGKSSYALGAHTDAHHIVAAERKMNSTKNNRHFEDCHDGDDTNLKDRGYGNFTCNDWEFEPRDEVKGDVARMIFYMAVRYEGEDGDYVDLEVVDDPDSTKGSKLSVYGDLDDLLRWHKEDPVSETEINRNQIIYEYQGNRNPFIDLPGLVEIIFGN